MVGVIILQFNSFRRTLLTFMTVPLIVVGIPYGLLATGQPLSFFGTLGIISLAGIIINNAIVLIDQIDIERSHSELREAIVAASQKRLRPILLTSATTVLGLAPMAVAGGALWQPMAVLMMSGLAAASLLTLLFCAGGIFPVVPLRYGPRQRLVQAVGKMKAASSSSGKCQLTGGRDGCSCGGDFRWCAPAVHSVRLGGGRGLGRVHGQRGAATVADGGRPDQCPTG